MCSTHETTCSWIYFQQFENNVMNWFEEDDLALVLSACTLSAYTHSLTSPPVIISRCHGSWLLDDDVVDDDVVEDVRFGWSGKKNSFIHSFIHSFINFIHFASINLMMIMR